MIRLETDREAGLTSKSIVVAELESRGSFGCFKSREKLLDIIRQVLIPRAICTCLVDR